MTTKGREILAKIYIIALTVLIIWSVAATSESFLNSNRIEDPLSLTSNIVVWIFSYIGFYKLLSWGARKIRGIGKTKESNG